MAKQFPSGIAGCTQGSDDRGLFCNGVVNGNRKYKGNDHNKNIKQNLHHRLIAAHIIPGEMNGLVRIARNYFCYLRVFYKNINEILGHVFGFDVILGLIGVLPGIAVFQMGSAELVSPLFCHNGNAEFYCIEHHVAVVGK